MWSTSSQHGHCTIEGPNVLMIYIVTIQSCKSYDCLTHSGRSLNLSRSMLGMNVSQSNCFKILVTKRRRGAELSIASCRNDTFHKYEKVFTNISLYFLSLSEYNACTSVSCCYCSCGNRVTKYDSILTTL